MAKKQAAAGSRKPVNLDNIGVEMGRKPPQAIDIEEAVLGALLIEPDVISDVVDLLSSDCFYKEAHQKIYRAIVDLASRHDPVDIFTVTDELTKSGDIDIVGGPHYLTQLSLKIGAATHVEYHCKVLLQKYIQRSLIEISYGVQRSAFDDDLPVDDLLQNTQQKIFTLAEKNMKSETYSIREIIGNALDDIEKAQARTDGLSGVPSGYSGLDSMTLGWQPSDLVIIAARPSMGKTAFVLNMARNMAVDHNVPVAFFSLEMSALQLAKRILVSETGLSAEKIRGGSKLDDAEWERLNDSIGALSSAPLWVDDTPSLSIFEFRSKARRLVANSHIKAIIIDYLQLMTGPPELKGLREQEVAHISRSLKSIAKELNVPIIALSQLSRQVETRGGDRRPMLSDLRESGAIEQDADIVIFINRPEYYGLDKSSSGDADIIIAKHRNGKVGDVKMTFLSQEIKFVDREYLDVTSDNRPEGDDLQYRSFESRGNFGDFPGGAGYDFPDGTGFDPV